MPCKFTLALTALLLAAALPCLAQKVSARLSILQTTDLHGHILEDNETPGVLKLASLIRQEYSPDKTLLIDCGDTFEGSFEAAATQGTIMLPVMNALPYDVWVPGNHDFDWGLGQLGELTSKLNCRKLAANLATQGNRPESFLAWTCIDKGGIKVAVVGMTSPYLEKWLWGDPFDGLQAQDIRDCLDKTMPEVLQANPDIIILAAHAGMFQAARLGGDDDSQLFAIARRHPEIDIILGGHSHQKEPGERIGKTTWFAQAGQHAEALLRIDIDYDRQRRRIERLESKTLTPDGLEPDPQLSAALKDQLDAIEKEGAASVGELKRRLGPFGRGKNAGNGMALLICQAIAQASGADIAFHGAHGGASFGPGPVTGRDLHKMIPYENRVGTLEITPGQCRRIIEEQAAIDDKARRMSAWGVKFKLTADGKVDGPLKLSDGSTWDDEAKRLKAAFSGYDLASSGGRLKELAAIAADPACKASDAGITTRDALRKTLSQPQPEDDLQSRRKGGIFKAPSKKPEGKTQ